MRSIKLGQLIVSKRILAILTSLTVLCFIAFVSMFSQPNLRLPSSLNLTFLGYKAASSFNLAFLPKYDSHSDSASINANNSTWCRDNLIQLLPKPGLVELAQYYATSKMNKIAMKYTSDNFNAIKSSIRYNFTSLVENDCIAFFIHERRLNNIRHKEPVRGGSAFHTIITGRSTIDFCPYVDHGNDTYTIFCPLYEPCIVVMSHLIHFDYLAFWPGSEFVHRAANVLAIHQNMCINNSRTSFPRLNKPYWSRRLSSKSPQYPKSDNMWSNKLDWHLQLNDQQSVHHMNASDFDKCKMTKVAAIDFVGDSHLDFTSYYIKNLEIDAAALRPSPQIVNNAMGRTIMHFTPKLRKIVAKHNATGKPTAILVDIGLHDICGGGLSFFANRVLPEVVQEFSRMQAKKLLKNVHLIFVSIVAMPPTAPKSRHRGANTAAIAAMNRLLFDSLTKAKINFTYVDYQQIVSQFVNKTAFAADNHYFNYDRKRTDGQKKIMYGPVGLTLANYLLSLVCS